MARSSACCGARSTRWCARSRFARRCDHMSVPASSTDVELRPTGLHDLDFVLAVERHPENAPFIGQWSREEHAAAIDRPDREHWIVEVAGAPDPVGFLIAYDLRAAGFGVHVKRIVVTD